MTTVVLILSDEDEITFIHLHAQDVTKCIIRYVLDVFYNEVFSAAVWSSTVPSGADIRVAMVTGVPIMIVARILDLESKFRTYCVALGSALAPTGGLLNAGKTVGSTSGKSVT